MNRLPMVVEELTYANRVQTMFPLIPKVLMLLSYSPVNSLQALLLTEGDWHFAPDPASMQKLTLPRACYVKNAVSV
jgi:hypothetical protein